jgi:hypothetical protein
MIRSLTYKAVCLTIVLFTIVRGQAQGVTGVKYQMRYDTTTCLFDCYIVITEGSATSAAQRAQFNAQYSIVVPAGSMIEVDTSYMPLIANQTYTGTIPMTWALTNHLYAPCAQPQNDFHSIIPILSPASFYNNLATGDTIRLFSLKVSPIPACASDIRIFKNGIDPPSSAPCFNGADFSCGFTIGGPSQDYTGNLPQVYPPKPAATVEVGCGSGVHLDLTATTSECQKPLTYQWSGPSTSSSSEDINISSNSVVYHGNYTVTVTDAFGCSSTATFYGENKPNGGTDKTTCAGGSIILNGVSPNNGTWQQDTNNGFGASLSSTSGGNATATFNPSASGDYYFVYKSVSCDDTVKVSVTTQEAGPIPDYEACYVDAVITLMAEGSGTWSIGPGSAGTALISNVNNPNATVSGFSGPGNYIMKWTNGSCSDQVVITVGDVCACTIADNTINDPSTTTFCGSTSGIFITGSTPTPAGGVYTWEYSSDGFTYNNAPGNFSTRNYTTGTLTEGTHYFRRKYETTSGVICEDISNTVVITVTGKPAPPALASNSPICEGDDLEITSEFVGGAFYNWSGPFGGSTDMNVFINEADLSNAGTYTLVIDVNGCQSDPATINVTIKAKPQLPDITSNAPLCAGDTLLLSTSVVPGATYSWFGPAFSPFSTDRAPSVLNATAAIQGTYFLTVEKDGCISEPNSVDVVVKNIPTAPQFITNSPVCEGDTLRLTAQDVPGANYIWTGPVTVPSIKEPVLSPVTAAFAGRYKLKVTLDGCESDTFGLNVQLKAKPATPVISVSSPICEGDSLLFTADLHTGDTYVWTTTASNSFTSSEQNPFRINATPNMSGKYMLRLLADGCYGDTAIVDALVKPKPAVPNISYNGPICEGDSLLFTATVADVNIIIAWNGVSSLDSIRKPFIENATTAMSGIYTAKSMLNGCESGNDSLTVLVKPNPITPAMSYNGPLCAEDNLQLTADALANASYAWTGPGGFSQNTQNPGRNNANTTMSGTYYLQVTVNGCKSDKDSLDVTIKPRPVTPIQASNSPVCEEQDILLTAGLLANASYAWTGPNAFTSNVQNPVITDASMTDAGNYILKVTVDGCESHPDTIQVTVKDKPSTPTITSNTPLCAEDNLQLGTTSTGVTYAWTGPDGFTSTTQNPTITAATVAKSGDYHLVVEANGCKSDTASHSVTIKAKPAVPSLLSNSPVCEDDEIQLSIIPVAGASYAWTGPNGFVSTTANPTISSAKLTDAGIYKAKVTVNGCVSDEAQISVLVNDRPDAPVINSNGPVCEGDLLTLSTPIVAGASYTWTSPSLNVINASSITITDAQMLDGGEYKLVISTTGCASGETKIQVTVKDKPDAPQIVSDSPVCEGTTVHFTISNVIAGNYTWMNNNNVQFSTLDNPVIAAAIPANSGNYRAKVELNGCESDWGNTSILVKPTPATPALNSNGPVCEGDDVILSAPVNPGWVYEWTNDNGDVVGNGATVLLTDALPTQSGTYTLKVEEAGCPAVPAQISVTINAKPNAPAIVNNGPVCEGETLQFEGEIVAGATYIWTDINGSVLGNNAVYSINNSNPAHSGIYYLEIEVNNCFSDKSSSNAIVYATPALPNIQSNSPLCEGGTLSLSTDVIAGASYTWMDATSTIISNLSSFTIDGVLPSMAGNYSLIISVNGCNSDAASEVITIFGKTADPVITGDSELCEGEDLVLSTPDLSGASYEWKNPFGTVVGNTYELKIDDIQITAAGRYTVVQTIDGCPSDEKYVDVVVNAIPTTPQIISNSPVCEGDVIVLSVDNVAANQLTWTGPLGTNLGNGDDVTINGAQLTDGGKYKVQASAKGCLSAVAETDVVVNKTPAIPTIISNAPVCEGEAISLQTAAVANATYIWTNPQGASMASQTQHLLASADASMEGTYTLSVEVDGCQSPQAALFVEVKAVPQKPAITGNSPVCEGEDLLFSTDLVTGASYSWTNAGGTEVSTTNTLNISKADASKAGTYQLVVSVDGCSSQPADVLAVVKEIPAIPVLSSNSPICEGEDLTINIDNVEAGVLYSWIHANGVQTQNGSNWNISNANTGDSGNFQVTATLNGCVSAPASLSVEVKARPTVDNVSDNTPLCEGGDLTLQVNGTTGAAFTWYNNNVVIGTGTSITLNDVDVSNSGIYEVEASLNGCTSNKQQIITNITPNPATPVISISSPICEGEKAVFSTTVVSGATYSWYNGANLLVSTGSTYTIPAAALTDAGNYALKLKVNGCESELSTTVLDVKPRPVVPVIQSNSPLCEGETLTLETIAQPGVVYSWVKAGQNLGTSDALSIGNAQVSDGGIYELAANLNGCVAGPATLAVEVKSKPTRPDIINNGPLCTGEQAVLTTQAIADQYVWSGVNGFTGSTAQVSVDNIGVTQGGIYELYIVVNGCKSDVANTTLEVNQKPALPIISNNAPLCSGEELILTGTAYIGGIYTWYDPNGNVIGGGKDVSITNIQAGQAGTYSFEVVVNGCKSDKATTNVAVKQSPSLPLASANSPVCKGEDIHLSTALVAGALYQWSGPALYTSNVQNPDIFNAQDVNGGIYILTIEIDGCKSAAATVEVRIENCACPIDANNIQQPSASYYCGNSGALVLSGSTPTPAGGSFRWEISTDGTVYFPAIGISDQKDYQVSDLTVGKHYFRRVYYTTTGIVCEESSNVLLIEVREKPTINVPGNNGPLCEGQDLQLMVPALTGATYAWTGPNTFVSNIQNPVINNVGMVQAGQYRVVADVNGCSSDPQITDVVVIAKPATPQITSNSPVCEGADIEISVSAVSGASFEWTGPAGVITGNEKIVISGASQADAGNYTNRIIVNGCYSDIASTTVQVIKKAAAPTLTSNAPLCEGENLELTTPAQANASYQWTGPVTITANSNLVQLNTVDPTYAGKYNLIVVVNGCSSLPAQIDVVVKAKPATPVLSSNSPVCISETIQLNASVVTGATYDWNGPSLFGSTDANPVINNATLAHAGIYTLVIEVNGCESETAQIQVNVEDCGCPIDNNKLDQPAITSFCGESDNMTLIGSTPSPAGGEFLWQYSTDGSNFTDAGSTNNGKDYTTGKLSEGTHYFRRKYSTTSGYICEKLSDIVTIVVKSKPLQPVINNNSPVCEGSTIVLQTTPVTGASYQWLSPGGAVVSTNISYTITNADAAAKGNYQLQIEISGCKSELGNTVVDVKPIPVISELKNDSPVCEGQDINLNAVVTGGVSYAWSGPLGFVSSSDSPVLVKASKNMEGSYELKVTLNGCTSAPVATLVTIKATPAKPTISSNSPICEGDAINLFTDAVSGAIYTWTGPNSFASGDQNPVIAGAVQAMGGTYTLNVELDGCQSPAAQMEVRVENCNCQIDNNTLADPTSSSFCFGDVNLVLSGSDATPTEGEYLWWYSDDNVNFKQATGGVITNRDYVVSNLPVGDHYFRRQYTTTSGVLCSEVTNTVHIEVKALPAPPVINNNGPVCPGEDIILNIDQVSGASYLVQGPGGFSQQGATLTLPKVDGADAGIYTAWITLDGCQSPASTTKVELKAVPTADNVNSNGLVCYGENIELSVDEVPGASYFWTGPNGFTSNDAKPVITAATAANAGDYSVYLVLDGCPGEAATIKVNTKDCSCAIANNGVILPNQMDYCERAENIILDGPAASPAGGKYEWQYSLNGGNFGQAGGNSDMEDYTIVLLGEGSHAFRRIYSTTGQNACSDTSNWVTLLVRPNPTVANFSVMGGICEGDVLSFNAQTVPGANYSWTGPNGFVSNQQNPTITATTAGATGTYTLKVQIPGCTSKEASQNVVVKPTPATPQLTSTVSVCEGEDISVSPGNVGNGLYNWTGPNNFNLTAQTLQLNNVTPSQAGQYKVFVDLNGCESKEANVNVEVRAVPQAPILNIANKLCEGESIVFESNVLNNDQVIWTGPNGWTSSSTQPKLSGVKPDQSGNYTVYITRNGCKSEVIDFDLNVAAKPATPQISNNGPVCEGKDLMLETGDVLGASFQWTGPNGFTSNEQNPVLTAVDSINGGKYTLTIVKDGCTSEVAAMDVEIKNCACYIEDNSISQPGPVLYCEITDNVDIFGNQVLPEGGSYQWEYSSDSLKFVKANGDISELLLKTGKLGVGTHYFRRVYSLNQGFLCADTSNILAIRVVSNDPSLIDLELDGVATCVGDTIQVLVHSDMPGANYNWSVGEEGMQLITSAGKAASFMPAKAGEYTVQVRQSIPGCNESDPALLKLQIKARPFISIGKDTTFCDKDGDLVLEAKGGEFTSYLWSDGSTASTLSVSEKGSYSVTITDEFGCSNVDEVTIKTFCCKITYPNIFMVDLGGRNAEFQLVDDGCVISSKLRIYDRWGNKVYDADNGLAPWDGKFNGNYVEQGVYTFLFSYTALDENEDKFNEVISGDVTVIRR